MKNLLYRLTFQPFEKSKMIFVRLLPIAYLCSSFILLLIRAQENSIDAQLGRRYEFKLFENSKGCAELYRKEAAVVDLLSLKKIKLLEIENKIKSRLKLLKNHTTFGKDMKELQLILHQGMNLHKKQKHYIKDMIENFPQLEDFIGSIKAMFMLHYSYGLNMSLAVQEGNLAYTNHFGKLITYQVRF